MNNYKQQMQLIVKEYRKAGQEWPATAAQMARWAIENNLYDLKTRTIERKCARDLAKAMREEYITDAKGRRVRAKHAAKTKRNGKQIMLWDDITTAPRDHMHIAFKLRRNLITADCRQLKTDVDSYNDAHLEEPPIQLVLDFTKDVEELEAANRSSSIEPSQPSEQSLDAAPVSV